MEEQFKSFCKKCDTKCNISFTDLYNLFDPLKDIWHPFHLCDCLCTDQETRNKNRIRHQVMQKES